MTFSLLVAIPSFTQTADAQSCGDVGYSCVDAWGYDNSGTSPIEDWSWISDPYGGNDYDDNQGDGGGGSGGTVANPDNNNDPDPNVNCGVDIDIRNSEAIRLYVRARTVFFDTYTLQSIRVIFVANIANNGFTVNWSNGESGTYIIQDGWLDNGSLNSVSSDELDCG